MALVSLMPAISPEISLRRYDDDIGCGGLTASEGETAEQVADDTVYVAVGKKINESKSTLLYVLRNWKGRKMCILYIHKPSERIPNSMGIKLQESQMEAHKVREYREIERHNMYKLLREYKMICQRARVQVAVLYDENDSIEKGIVELIEKKHIRMLIMGASADKNYFEKMTEPKSRKALYVRSQAPISCHIWFVCKGQVVQTRETRLEGASLEVVSLTRQASPTSEKSSPRRSRSPTEMQNDQLKFICLGPSYNRVRSANHATKPSTVSLDNSGAATPLSPLIRSNLGERFSKLDGFFRSSPLVNSSTSSAGNKADSSSLTLAARTDDRLESRTPSAMNDHRHISPSSVLEGSIDGELYDQLELAMAKVEVSNREAFEEWAKCRKTEKDAIDAFHRVKSAQSSYATESTHRKEIEEALLREKEEVKKMKLQLHEVMEELRTSLEQRSSLESKINENSDQMVQELEQKMFSAVELLQQYKKERDELQVERDNALQLAGELRKKQSREASHTLTPLLFSEFPFSEIEEATRNFDPSLKVGEGGYGSIYRCTLRNKEVAVKILQTLSSQGPSEFQQEVNVLTKLRHPNLVTLIGACPEAWILVYEYYPNGSLEDRLGCIGNTPPLSWQTRIRIAAELCSVLVFLHSRSPQIIVHGDLKPANILLDANDVSKLSDFGICRVISQKDFSSGNKTLCWRTYAKGTFAYVDPEFVYTGELSAKSDVYSFGVILLRLLTGISALGITKEVHRALDKGNLKDLLDRTAGDWPFAKARMLTHLAMRCCEINRRERPDLTSEVWTVLERMRVWCDAHHLG